MKKILFFLSILFLSSISVAATVPEEDESDLPNKPVMQCVVDGEVVVFFPNKFMFILQGLNGNPDGLMAEDTKGKVHTFFQVKNSPYKCKIVDETEV
jgi:hypothetical protein